MIHSTNDFFKHIIKVSVWSEPSRRPGFFKQYCEGKNVLHMGCSDAPFAFNIQTSLHYQLSLFCKNLDGFDLNSDNFPQMASAIPGGYFSDINHLYGQTWDVCLVPETIEHVDNIKEFCESINKIDAKTFIITAPNAFHPNNKENTLINQSEYLECVHPDHKVWFSPYTLTHCIRTYMPNVCIKQVWLIENQNMIAVVFEK
jgi:hypothetical protein